MKIDIDEVFDKNLKPLYFIVMKLLGHYNVVITYGNFDEPSSNGTSTRLL